MDFLQKQEKIEKIIARYEDIIGEEAWNLRIEYSLQTADKNREVLKKIENENRLIRIGIVGRVKAGKSSLLNALLFNGKSILPKAATPMTSALTIISSGKNLSAEVEFFTENDLEEMEEKHHQYLEKRKKLLEIKKNELRMKKKGILSMQGAKIEINHEEQVKIEEKAEKLVDRELKNDIILYAAYDQYERIISSGIELQDLKMEDKSIKADYYEELHSKLLYYVGANGKYTPFTKSVHIFIPDEKLKNIQIIDTPGINDPIQSREARTRELLKYCDVILIASPSGQFLSAEDIELMDRITSKEGIRELYVVATQIDTQLMGSIKRESNGNLHDALDKITSLLANHMYNVITKLKSNNFEVRNIYDQLIKKSKDKIIHSSAMCQSMVSQWDNKNEWDSSTKTVWNNLKINYPDYFSDNDKELTIANLNKMANTDAILDIIRKVQVKKNSILKQRKEEFVNAKLKVLEEYQKKLINYIDNRLEEIKSGNLKKLKNTQKEMEKIKEKTSVFLNESYDNRITGLEIELNKLLKKILNNFIDFKRDIENAERNETESIKVNKEGIFNKLAQVLWGGGKEQVNKTYTTIRTGAVKDSIVNLTLEIEKEIKINVEEITQNWRKKTPTELIKAIRNDVDDEYLDVYLIIRAIRNLFNKITIPEIEYSGTIPKTLNARGTLKEDEAEEYISKAWDYVNNLKKIVNNDIKNFINNLIRNLKKVDIVKELFLEYDKQIEELKQQIEYKKLTMERFSRLKNELNNIDK